MHRKRAEEKRKGKEMGEEGLKKWGEKWEGVGSYCQSELL